MLHRVTNCWNGTLMATAVLTAACEQYPVSSVDEIVQEYVFEVEYRSSWFPSQVGIVIDRDGRMLSYSRDGLPVSPSSEAGYTGEELAAKYGDASELTQIDPVTLLERFNQTFTVRDRFSQPNVVCADAGQLTYTAFGFDHGTELYHPVTLREEGDRPRQNVTGRAPELSDWLRALVETHPVENLQAFPDGVCTP